MKLAKLNWLRRAASALVMLCAISLAAYAAGPTLISSQTPVGPYPGTVSAGQLALTFTAADATNGNSFALSGHEILIIYNSGASAYTVTISSVADQYGRTQDITAYSVANGSYAVFSFRGGVGGWKQSDGTVHVTASNAAIEFAVLYVQ